MQKYTIYKMQLWTKVKYKEPYEKPKQKLIKKQPHEHGDMTKAKTLIRNFSSNRF